MYASAYRAISGAPLDLSGQAGRRRSVSGPAFWSLLALFLVMATWTAGTAAYLLCKDEILAGLVGRQADMQYAYEDRIASLRAQVDRLNSRQLLDGEQLERRVEQLAQRQAVIEARASALSGLPSRLPTPVAPPSAGMAIDPAPPARPMGDLRSSLEVLPAPQPGASKRLEARVMALEGALDRIDASHSAALAAIAAGYDASARQLRGVLSDLGVALRRPLPDSAGPDTGGPFVPVSTLPATDPFERQLAQVHAARAHVDRLSRTLGGVPVRKPLAGELDVSSGFGTRADPFLRVAAHHAGLDFRAPPGTSVRATAGGVVVSAGWSGGYGRMVEIDHGNGLTTRYGHLSDTRVSENQAVRPGQVIGHVGSSGRSTGPHLHYETRIDGEPVDPHRFLRAGLRLGARL